MGYVRIGHSSKHFARKGDYVKKGQKIAEIGTGNGQWSSHAHVDFPQDIIWWTDYVFGKTKDDVKKLFANPKKHRKTMFPDYDHMGWGYLELATYGTKKCYHPGEDWNGKGAGNSDIGMPLYAPFNGTVVYEYSGKDKNAGWGYLMVIREEGDTSLDAIKKPPKEEVAPIPIKVVEEASEVKNERLEVIADKSPEPTITPKIIEFIINLIKKICTRQ